MSRARSAAGALSRVLQAAAAPMYVLDDSRHIVFANAALLAWLEVEESQLLGARCDYHSAADSNGHTSWASLLCPPPEAFSAAATLFTVRIPRADGTTQCRSAECFPLESAAPGATMSAPVLVKLAGEPGPDAPAASASCRVESESRELHQRLVVLRQRASRHYRFDRFLGTSPIMRRVLAQAEMASKSLANVLIVGPRGSGREHLARSIHQAADGDAAGTLVPLACELLDAETMQTMVRHLKRRPASRDGAHHEVLLLLEVDRMPADAQDELAGFLNLPDFRLPTLATARRALASVAAAGSFRHDLACLLSTLVIELPSLAERRDDIPLVAQRLLEEHNQAGGAQLAGFTPEALDELVAYPWPGNLDELAQYVAEACDRASGPWVTASDLPARIRLAHGAAALPRPADEPLVIDEFLAQIERELIERAVARAKGNRTKASALLGVSRARLLRRLVQLGLAEPAAADEGSIAFEEVEFVPHDEQEAE